MNGEQYINTELNIQSNTVNQMDSMDNKKKCTNCKCWRDLVDFIGVKGNEVKQCKKCRDKDAQQKKKPEIAEKRNALQREKKYYQVYRDRKRAEDEEAYKKKCAETTKAWRDKQKEQHSSNGNQDSQL